MPSSPSKTRPATLPKQRRGALTTKNSKTSPKAIATEQKRAEAIQLRLAGWKYEVIGETLGVTGARAYQLVNEALAARINEPLERLRELELDRLDELLTGVWDGAVAGDPIKLNSALSIMARRARMLGIDAPVKVEGEVHHEMHHSGGVQVDQKITVEFVSAKDGKVIEGFARRVNGKPNGG